MGISLWLFCPCCQQESDSEGTTHNLTPMWDKAGVKDALYNSDGKAAGETIAALEAGLADMRAKPEEYRALNPANGWGDYAGALRFLTAWLALCKRSPQSIIVARP